MLKRIALSLVAASLLLATPAAGAQEAARKPIRMLVGFPPGQATELIARVLAEQLTKSLGQTVIVENRPGQGGSLALGVLAKSPADGSVIALSALAALVANPHLYKSVPYDTLKDSIRSREWPTFQSCSLRIRRSKCEHCLN